MIRPCLRVSECAPDGERRRQLARQYVQKRRKVRETVIALRGQDLDAAEGLRNLSDFAHHGTSDGLFLPWFMVEADRMDICLFEDLEEEDNLSPVVHTLIDAYAARHPGNLCLWESRRQRFHHILKSLRFRVGGEDGNQKRAPFHAEGTKGADDAFDLGRLGNDIRVRFHKEFLPFGE